jgi:hypothetical protein
MRRKIYKIVNVLSLLSLRNGMLSKRNKAIKTKKKRNIC